jgi:hypothetical protein
VKFIQQDAGQIKLEMLLLLKCIHNLYHLIEKLFLLTEENDIVALAVKPGKYLKNLCH